MSSPFRSSAIFHSQNALNSHDRTLSTTSTGPRTDSDELGDILANLRDLLSTGGDVLKLAPIPGLETAAKAVSSFIGVIQVRARTR